MYFLSLFNSSITFLQKQYFLCKKKNIKTSYVKKNFDHILNLEASGSLWIDLERINLEESWSKVILWLPEDWLNSDQRIYTKRILLQPSFNKGNLSCILNCFSRYFSLNKTRKYKGK